MSEMTFEQAASALSEASAAPEPGQVSEAVAPEATSPTPPAPEVDTTSNQDPAAPTEQTPDSFTNIDPNSLPDELKSIYRNMQADYTRKNQAIAEQSKQYEGLDPSRASQAVQFLDALETDPNFVVAVHQQLSQALQDAGLSRAQADATAASQIQETQTAAPQYDEYGNEVGPDPVQQQIQELTQWKQQMEAQQAEMQLASQLQSAEMAIRQQNPNWTDSDMETVFELAFAHGGNLIQAAGAYKGLQDRLVSSYIAGKASAAEAAPTVIESTGSAQIPAGGFGEDMDAAHRAAKAHLANLLAQD